MDNVGKIEIDQLPVHILRHIFSYLGTTDFYLSVALVCKSWLELTRDPLLPTHLCLKPKSYESYLAVCNVIAMSPNLLSLKINLSEIPGSYALVGIAWTDWRWDFDTSKVLEILANCCPKLCRLKYKGDVNHISYPHRLENLSKNCPNLMYLDLSHSVIGFGGANFHNFHNLTYLDVSNVANIGTQALVTVADLCPRLKYCNVTGVNYVSDIGLTSLAHSRAATSTLTHLFLNCQHFREDSFMNLQLFTNLKELSLESARYMSQFGLLTIRMLEFLTYLKIDGYESTELCELFKNRFFCRRNLHLEHLCLSQCTDISAKDIIAAATSYPKLKHLAFVGCPTVNNAGLALFIARCRRLRILELVKMPQLSVDRLLDILPQLTEMEALSVAYCQFSYQELVSLCTALPAVKVFSDRNILLVCHHSLTAEDNGKWSKQHCRLSFVVSDEYKKFKFNSNLF